MQNWKEKFDQLTLRGKLLLLVLFLGGVWFFWPKQTEIIPAARQVTRLAEIIRQEFAAKPDFWGLSAQSLAENADLPPEMKTSRGLTNLLGKPILVGGDENGAAVMPGNRSFKIIFTGLNRSECIQLAAYVYPQQEALGLLNMAVINDLQQEVYSWGEDQALPIAPETAKKVCNVENKIVWTFGK